MTDWTIPLLAFVAVACAIAALSYMLSAPRRRVGRRLDSLGRDPVERTPRQADADRFPTLTNLLEQQGRHSLVEDWLDRAGVAWRPSEFAAAALSALVVLAAVGWFFAGPLGAACGIVVATLGAWGTVKSLELQRTRQFERQLPDALMMMASSLRSGYGILRAMQAVRDEMKPPIALEFGRTLDEANLGVPTAEALTHLARRVLLPDLDIAVTAIIIQLDTGGNLAEVLEIVARTVRERQRIRAEVSTLTAEGRMSGVILYLLPIIMFAVLQVLNPSYMSALLTKTLGQILLLLGLSLQTLGGIVIWRMLRVDF